MNIRVSSIAIASLLGCQLVASNVIAHPIRVDIVGVVSEVGGHEQPFTNVFSVGDPIQYSFTFNESPGPSSSGILRHPDAIIGFAGSVGTYAFSGSSGNALVHDDFSTPPAFVSPPYDHVAINVYNLIANEGYLGIPRDDFSLTSGDVEGYPLRMVQLSALTDDLGYISGQSFNTAIIDALAADPALIKFRIAFSDEFNGYDVFVLGDIESVNWARLGDPLFADSFELAQ